MGMPKAMRVPLHETVMYMIVTALTLPHAFRDTYASQEADRVVTIPIDVGEIVIIRLKIQLTHLILLFMTRPYDIIISLYF